MSQLVLALMIAPDVQSAACATLAPTKPQSARAMPETCRQRVTDKRGETGWAEA